jgi:hypothetical protein
MHGVTRNKKASFIEWIVKGRTQISPDPILNVLKSEKTARDYPNVHWSKLQLLIIDWADQQCSRVLRSGSPDIFADIGQLYGKFAQHWKNHQLDFIAVYPEAQTKWSIEQLGYLPQCLFELLLDGLTGSEDRTETRMVRPYDRQRIRSNAYELSHYLLNLRQRLNANAAIIEQPRLSHMLKVHSKERSRPKRNIKFHEAIWSFLSDIKHRDLASSDWEIIQQSQGREWLLEVWGDFLNKIEIKEIAPFQLKCFTTLLDSALLADGCPEPIMITANTGFGKTEAFLFPILFYATINLLRQKQRSFGPDAILVYPRIDLCNNQLERYLWYAHCLKESVLASPRTAAVLDYVPTEMFRANLGHSGAKPENESGGEPFNVECPICKVANQDGFINLRKPRFTLIPFCSRDENSHDINPYLNPQLSKWAPGRFTVAISTVDTLHRRLMDLHGRATLWKNNRFLPRFIVLDEIHIYEGQYGSHVANLVRRLKVYLKNIKLPDNSRCLNPLPPIFVGATATIGNPQEVGSAIFGVPEVNMDNRVLKPEEAESEPLGREYTYLLKTPPTREMQDENNGRNRYRLVSEQASLLQALMAFWHAMRKTFSQQETPGKHRLLTFVDSIDSVWRITRNLDDAESNQTKQLYQFRIPRGCWDNSMAINGNNTCPKFACKEICVTPPHQFFERCGIYQQGECWWSMAVSPDGFLRPMQIVGRISGFTRQPQNFTRDQNLDQWDCMISTSTLEVGFDHSELIATAQFKAPPNPASFQQRKGRGGRGIDDIPLTLMVLGNSPGDLFAFKHEQRYFEPTQDDLKIQFDAKNKFIRNQHVLSAIYDFMSWQGITQALPNIYNKCDIHLALRDLKKYREDLNNWIIDLYSNDGLNREECINLAGQCISQMKQSVVNLNRDFPGICNSVDLFQREVIPPHWRIDLQHKIRQDNSDSNDKKTLVVIQAAERWKKTFLHPPNYFNRLPIDEKGLPRDSSWIIPESFIPSPIGGTIVVEGTGANVTEPKLQTLASFLPGGFKHRWGFNLWYGEWLSVPNHYHCADISHLARDAEDLGTLQDLLIGRPMPSTLSSFNPQVTHLVNPRTIKVHTGQENFSLTNDRTRVKNVNDGPGGVRLSREPSSVVQTYDLIVEQSENLIPISLNDKSLGIERIQFGENDLLRLFYSNLVNCYPSAIGNANQPSLSINLKFYDREKSVHTIPTVKLHTQGILLEGSLSQSAIQQKIEQSKIARTYEDHFWRLVYRLLWREAFLNHNLLGFNINFSFDCIKILKILRFLDFQTRLAKIPLLESISNVEIASIFDKSRNVCAELRFDLFEGVNIIASIPTCWSELRDKILTRARSELQMEIAESFVQSLSMAICRDIADKTNTNLDLIKVSVEAYQLDNENHYTFRACVYDNIEGGNGTTSSYIDRINRSISLEEICAEQKQCDTNCDELAILALLQDQSLNADMLYSLVGKSGELKNYGLSEKAIFKVSRLISSPSITAFYQGVAENYKVLNSLLQREPGEEELAYYLMERPIADPRGNQLFEQFIIHSGGISELIPRIAEIMPLCHGSCPDCLGDSRLSFEKGERFIADRHLIGDTT